MDEITLSESSANPWREAPADIDAKVPEEDAVILRHSSADPGVSTSPRARALRSAALLMAGAIGLQAGGDAFACGDKFVRVGRGARYQRGYVALHPASIVVYLGSGATASGTLKGMEPALKAAGHKVITVKADALVTTLSDGKHDLVLADFADASRIAGEVKAAPNPPELLPVMKKPTPDAFAEAEKQWLCVVGDPGDKYEVLTSIDKLLEKRK